MEGHGYGVVSSLTQEEGLFGYVEEHEKFFNGCCCLSSMRWVKEEGSDISGFHSPDDGGKGGEE